MPLIMRFISTIFVLIVTFFAATGVCAQNDNTNIDKIGAGLNRAMSIQDLERSAEKARKKGDVFTAWKYYHQVIQLDSSRTKAFEAYADLGLELYILPRAEDAYTYLAFRDSNKIDQDMLLKLAEVKVRQSAYEDAEFFLDSLRNSQVLTEGELNRLNRKLARVQWARDSSASTLPISAPLLLSPEVNTEYFAEYSPVIFENRLYFSSYRFPFANDKHNPQRNLVKIMSATPNADTLSARVLPINENELHSAHATFSADGQRMYYSICEFKNVADLRCDIYLRRRKSDGSWGAPEKLPEPINLPNVTTTEPSWAQIEEGEEVLFFVSDREGGAGGRDIWSVELKGNGYGEPKNEKKINREGDEVTPNYHTASQTLYFSSDSYDNMGGLDIFSSERKGSGWKKPQNLGSAINSGYNDVFFYKTANGRSAYFSSNRLGGYNESEEGCCYDIFKALLVKPGLLAMTFNEETCKQPRMDCDSIRETTMQLYKMVDGVPVLVQENFTPTASRNYEVELNQEYRLIAKKPYHRPDTIDIAPFTILEDTVRLVRLFLDPAHVKVIASVYDKKLMDEEERKVPMDSTTMRFVDFGKVDDPITNPLPTENSQTSHVYTYDLDFGRQYELFVSKPGHTTDRTDIRTDFYTEKDTVIEKELFIERGLMLVTEVFDGLDSLPIQNVSFRIDKRNESTPYLAKTVDGNTIHTAVAFGDVYQVWANSDGYYADSTGFFRAPRQPKAAFDTIYKKIYLFPDRLEKYLPITLFFHNDVPSKRPSNQDQTNEQYFNTWTKYLQLQPTYDSLHTINMTDPNEIADAKVRLNTFFQDSVRRNGERLNKFMEILFVQLEADSTIKITLKGFASPLAKTEYNKHLTRRRIYCIDNYIMREYRGGALVQFGPTGSGLLQIDTIPNGEALSDTSTLSKIDGPGIGRDWSVYSVEASKERRVQIVGAVTRRSPARPPTVGEEEEDERP